MKFILIGLFVSIYFGAGDAFADFDHTHKKWDHVLKQFTIKKESQVYFKYKEVKKDAEGFNSYLTELESLSKDDFGRFNRNERLAFWINAYNAYTVQIILKHYPVKSIKDISSGWFSSGPWKKDFINLFGEKISLDYIEHDIIRKRFSEPRIHFAVNCASIGCPSLLQEAYVGNRLNEQLDLAAQNFLHNKSKNYIKGNTFYLSKIFKWYGDDFKPKYGGFKNYVIETLRTPGQDYNDYNVEFNDYDWNLNELD